MPSTGRKLPISEKFGKARAFSFGTRHKTKSKFYPKFLGEGHPDSLSLKMARKRTKSETKSMTENDTTAVLKRQDSKKEKDLSSLSR